jgi:cation:H+ antiporter
LGVMTARNTMNVDTSSLPLVDWPHFGETTVILVWVKFAICVLLSVLAGRKAAKYGDAISEKTGLGGVWVGVALLAVVTSIPELFTGISSVAIVDPPVPDLAIGDLFGSNTINLAIIAVLCIGHNNGPVLTAVAQGGHLRTAALGLLLAGFAAICVLVSDVNDMGIGWLGLYTPIIIILYLLMMRVIFNYEQAHPQEEEEEKYEDISARRVYVYFGLAAVVIIGAAIWLAFIGDEIAREMDWGHTFVGTILVAITTSLPELTVSVAALKIGSVNMAVGNMLGSNLCNMGIVGVVDLFYWEAPVLSTVSQTHALTGLFVVLMSGVVIAGLLAKTRRRIPSRVSWYAVALIALYIGGAYATFVL